MAEFVAILSTSWRLITTINDVLSRIEQTREDARALRFLHRQANSFLVAVNEGLLGRDTSPYTGTILSLERLLNDILKASTDYVQMSTMTRLVNSAQTKRTILQLERRLQFFVNTYLIQTATQNKRIDLDAFSRPVTPLAHNDDTLLPDDVRWDIMTHGETLTTSISPWARILSWSRDIAIEPLFDPQSARSNASQRGDFKQPVMRRGSGVNIEGSEAGNAPEARGVGNGVQTPEGASLAAVDEIEEDSEPIFQNSTRSTTSNYQPPENRRPPSPAAPDWQSVQKCVECVLDDRNVELFLGIFSLSKNFDCVVDVLETTYYSNPLSDMPGTRVGVLTVAAKFVSHLWLADAQISKLSKAFSSKPPPRVRYQQDPISWTADAFFESLRKLTKENDVAMEDPVASLSSNKIIRVLAVELAQALAVLEDRLRRTDPVGECIRWSARTCTRDFLSFPERVKMWVLQTILQDEMPENIGLRYQLFYKVAKRSKEIHNFSAVRAIMSALQALEQIHIETKVGTSELLSMMSLDVVAGDYDMQYAQRNQKPYLQSLEDIFLQVKFSIDNVADTHHQIHWGNYLKFREEVDSFASQTELTSSQKYVFDGNRMVGFVKRSLINVEVVDDVATKVKRALRRYWRVLPAPGPLFHTKQASINGTSRLPMSHHNRLSPTGSSKLPLSEHYQASLLARSYR